MNICLNTFLLIFWFSTSALFLSALNSDGTTLLSLVRHWEVVPPSILLSYNASDTTPCSWLGVQCNRHNFVTYLNFNSFGISGKLGPEISYIKHLKSIDFGNNSFSGPIPSALSNCSHLEFLDLSINSFSGEIPENIGKLQKLEYLSLYSNLLTGTIPEPLSQIPFLDALYLHDNRLSGSIPSIFGNMSSLVFLWLNNNQLSGNIPFSLGNCSSLRELYLSNNLLEGALPSSLTISTQLVYLYLDNNNFEGKVRFGISCKNLQELVLSFNRFSGTIPPELGNCSSLTSFAAVNCGLSGQIPSSLGQLANLTLLYLSLNHLSGEIPPELGKFKSLTDLQLHGNRLEGLIPSSLGNLTSVTSLDISFNRLTGHIPQELGQLENLEALNLSRNRLEGVIPSQLSSCRKLSKLDSSYNMLSGRIPSTFSFLTELFVLVLSENRLEGGIPPFLFKLGNLQNLQLGANRLGGNVPVILGVEAKGLSFLNLSWNNITGHVPLEFGKLTFFQQLDICCNNLSGSLEAFNEVHSLTEINVSYNDFSGPIPNALMTFFISSPSSFIGNPELCVHCPWGNCLRETTFQSCDQRSGKRGHKIVNISLIICASVLFVVFVFLVLSYLLRPIGNERNLLDPAEEGASLLLNQVLEATENLNDRYIIGRGAHGTVYKATLGTDRVYALKKLSFVGLASGKASMDRELQTIGTVRHRNLVKLEDFWLRNDYGLILFHYMENGSLHDVLHERNPLPSLEWSVRYKIAFGIAQGLTYLHFDCIPAIIHRDIKPMNILLDSEMEPHISDFGIAKLLDELVPSMSSSAVQGTIGYIAPEKAFSTRNSKESDVYAYGVVLLELITRKAVLDPWFGQQEISMVEWVESVLKETGDIGAIVDPNLANELNNDPSITEQVEDVVIVALSCTEKEADKRPSMRDVVKQLVLTKPNNARRINTYDASTSEQQ